MSVAGCTRPKPDVMVIPQSTEPAPGSKPGSLVHADHMDKRGRQHRTWPGAGRNGSMRPPDHLVHSRSAPLPNDLIVSLLPSGTEVLFALGLANRCSAPHNPPHIVLNAWNGS